MEDTQIKAAFFLGGGGSSLRWSKSISHTHIRHHGKVLSLKDTTIGADSAANVVELQGHGLSVYALASGTEGPQHLNFLGLVGLRFSPQQEEPMDWSHQQASRPPGGALCSPGSRNLAPPSSVAPS